MSVERIVRSGQAALAVREWGRPEPARPTIVLTHGWPDSSAVWDLVIAQLASTHHVVAYDTRGVGRSTPALVRRRAYALEELADDLDAVIAAVSPGRPVHLVGHDWGSVVGWEYVGRPETGRRVASFTSLSGPSLDYAGHAIRARLRRPSPSNLAPVAAQALRSGYTLVLSTPLVRTLIWRLGMARLFRRWLAATEGISRADGYPGAGLAPDAIAAVPIYRSNLVPKLRRPSPRPTSVPVLLVVATRDLYVSPRLAADLDPWVPDLTRRELPAGHWSPRTHPHQLADLIAQFVASIGARHRTRAPA